MEVAECSHCLLKIDPRATVPKGKFYRHATEVVVPGVLFVLLVYKWHGSCANKLCAVDTANNVIN